MLHYTHTFPLAQVYDMGAWAVYQLESLWQSVSADTQFLYGFISGFIKWLFDPVQLADSVLSVFGWLVSWLDNNLSGNAASVVAHNHIGVILQSGILYKLYGLALYFLSPMIDPSVVQGCVDAYFAVWEFSILLSLAVRIWAYVWGAE